MQAILTTREVTCSFTISVISKNNESVHLVVCFQLFEINFIITFNETYVSDHERFGPK